jgi:hypothetical protein
MEHGWCKRKHEIRIKTAEIIGAGTVQSIKRLATGWTAGRSEFESRYGLELSLLHVVQTGSGAHQSSYRMGIGGPFPGGKYRGQENMDLYIYSENALMM